MDDNRPQENASPQNRRSSDSNSNSSSSSSFGSYSSSASVEPKDPQDLLLNDALRSGDLSTAQHLLSAGAPILCHHPEAPILCHHPEAILYAPPAQQIPLFELLAQHGWTPNTPGYYGAVLLPSIVTNRPLLQWFLEHGADPNLGMPPGYQDHIGSSFTDSGAALTTAARAGDLEAVRLLLNAGARAQNGAPLHAAAGACPPGTPTGAELNEGVTSSKEFDESRIPVMALLVEHGADVNAAEDWRYVLAQYPIVLATMDGAVERVKWLLAQGADPKLKGYFGNAVEYAKWRGSADMKRVLGIPVDNE